ncbi:hypothetical protein [Colwellia sp. 12G3]|uniref:hypothetical protein n=1 Tax=Colwellia sp. 12G3 TaxID=2058299 RepID=UPI000C32490B|nr:hypothetical protein [Colwellia sp. 12G3]PKI16041.1 hypothetical protein CXF71_10320 [Colwellia sp. 12G3]
MSIGQEVLGIINPELLDISDNERAACSFFKNPSQFGDTEGERRRKPLIMLSIFSLIYNLAGIKITGSGIGIVSGTISNPAIIGYALFIALVYSLVVYLILFWSNHGDYYLRMTDIGNQKKYEESLIRYWTEEKVKLYLRNNHIDINRIQFQEYDGDKIAHKFRIFGAKSYQNELIFNLLNGQDGLEFKDDEATESALFYTVPYELTSADMKYFLRHFKNLKVLHFKNFIEFRVPYMFAILAISSFWLRF